ncbi:MAG: hypothetical protein J4224_01455 [Candidatus Diapherotrites archaeon]|uniref:Uncharacterized protein n=1 Tax=Candidatus Iainarchaeum sp. TaxID=3101447 RepID=A0A7J4IRN3_9ARCH|nr:MAG: hypothetical protein QT03_C0001G1225 [archaeon GW2011_AR10]MBS3059071.1 hypothetical protein [Candidatus Diapherotrites archaeon]HIH08158.1 hypothetical protein [Candidatus Diapherotrites archaeon]
MNSNQALKVVFLFILSYILLYSLGAVFGALTGFRDWGFTTNIFKLDYFYFLIPIPAFFFMFFLVDWIEQYFETKLTRNFIFPVFFVALALIAYYVAVFWFYCNLFSLAEESVCSANGSSAAMQYVSQTFVSSLLQSPYIIFVLAAVLGWLSKLLVERFE